MPTKSTNVRPLPFSFRLIRAGVAFLDRTAPALAARWVERAFLTPPRHPRPEREKELIDQGRSFSLPFEGGRLAGWAWGSGPKVYLLHGWGGRAGQFHAIVPALVEGGFEAVGFDAPGHGESTGRRSSLLTFAAALRAVMEAQGPAHAVIAHSLGAAASTWAFSRGLKAGRAVFFAPPAHSELYYRQLLGALGIHTNRQDAYLRRFERRAGFKWDDFRMPELARSLGVPLLVAHDEMDAEVPWSEGAALTQAWPEAQMLTTRGLGHRRILRDPETVASLLEFLKEVR